MPLHVGKGRTLKKALQEILDYVENPQKTDEGRLVTSYQCSSRIADAEFLFSKRQYLTRTGRQRGRDDVIAYHLRQSFVPGEITPEEANRLGRELAMRFTKGNHAFIVCTHIDRHHIHNHLIFNSTSLDCTRKFRNFWGSTRALRRLSDTICLENGYSIVENPKPRGKSYDQWLGGKPPCHRDQLRAVIDTALTQKPADLDALVKLLENADITVEQRGKSLRLKAQGRKRFVRLDAHSMGEEYDLSTLLDVLAGKKEHIPQVKTSASQVPPSKAKAKVNLLVDIQARLQAGKGAGYARWASVFNLKQMAKTMNYLTEHNLLDYADLAAKTAEASARYNDLSTKIKAAEKRMTEIGNLKTQIINYSKTRDVYVAYRKAGYSKKFLAAHESEILLHQTAKKYFDGLGLKKLPTVKSLQAEYAALLEEKKVAYTDYRQAREEMKELLTVKANVDRLLEKEEREEKENARQQTSVQKEQR